MKPDFMPGAGVRLWWTISPLYAEYDTPALRVLTERDPISYCRSARYYRALDAINAYDRLLCGSPGCALCQPMEQFP